MGFDIKGLLLVLAIVVVLFGTKRLRSMGGDLGSAIKGFRSAMHNSDDDKEDKDDKGGKDNADDDPQVLEHNSEAHPNSRHEAERSVSESKDHS